MTFQINNPEKDFKPSKLFLAIVYYSKWLRLGFGAMFLFVTYTPEVKKAMDFKLYITQNGGYFSLFNVVQLFLLFGFIFCVIFANKQIDIKTLK